MISTLSGQPTQDVAIRASSSRNFQNSLLGFSDDIDNGLRFAVQAGIVLANTWGVERFV